MTSTDQTTGGNPPAAGRDPLRAIVTGASSGIGLAAAVRFAIDGARVGLVGRRLDALEAAADQVARAGGEPVVLQADVSDEDRMAEAVRTATAAWGGLDVVVANAAVQLHGQDRPIADLEARTWELTIRANLTGMFVTCKHGVRALLASGGGCLVIVGSPTGLRGNARGYPAYSASKAGTIGLMRQVANDYGPLGIRVNAVVPGFTETPLVAGVSDARRQQLIDATPLGRAGTPEEVAGAIRFLCTADAAFIHGAVLVVDGGRLAVG